MKDLFDSLRSDPHLNIGILTDRRRDNHKNDPSWDWDKNEDVRLSPESIASVSDPPPVHGRVVLTFVHRLIFSSSTKIDRPGVGRSIVSLKSCLYSLSSSLIR